MFRRTRPIAAPVTIHLDDAAILAERGEPLAVALLAAGETALARSPKLHRPRAPSCLRGGCDGCLARVDGVPNVMTCLRPAQGGERIETQNIVGSRHTDLLRVTDWFFPQGIDHHHLLAGVPGVSDVMQSFARKLAGLGRLPSAAEPVHPAERLETDVAVVGGGPSGIAVAARLAEEGLRVLLVDDGLAVGGSLRALPDRAPAFLAAHPLARVTVLSERTAIGVYLGEIVVASRDHAEVVRARAIVFATGAHDRTEAFPNDDLPGVMSARAVCHLLARGIEPDGPVAVVTAAKPGADLWADELAARLGDRAFRVDPASIERVHGTGHVRAVSVRDGDRVGKRAAVVVAIAGPGAPSFELAEQAGARVVFTGAGYRVAALEAGALELQAPSEGGPALFAVGECTGAPLDLAGIERDAAATTSAVLAAMTREK
jgi:sarcosine oxidase subunit alpha